MNGEVRSDFPVAVRCFTYNHKLYIEDAFNGFCIQETSFPYVCIVVDDASTDGEQGVIINYLVNNFDVVDCRGMESDTDDYVFYYAKHKYNKNCFFAVFLLKYNHYQIKKDKLHYFSLWLDSAKYIALCEGDDFWIHPHKLQKQLEYMETHPDSSLCFHADRYLYPNGSFIDHYVYKKDMSECPLGDLIMGGGGIMATASMMYLKTAVENYPLWPDKCGIGDAPLMLVLAERGKVAYLNELMCVYRVATEGSWTQRVRKRGKNYKQHYRRIIKMWDDYDEWSGYKYHKFVKKKKFKQRMHYYVKRVLFLIRN